MEAEGVGAPDGRIDVMESLIIVDTVCITIAGIIRIVVNSVGSLNWDEDLVLKMTNNRGCLSFDWNAGVMTPVDIIYLILCLIPLVSMVFVVWNSITDSFILSKIIIYQHKKTDEHKLEQFKAEIEKELTGEEFYNLVLKYEEVDLRFILFARGRQSKFIAEKNKIAMKKAVRSKIPFCNIIRNLQAKQDQFIHSVTNDGDTVFTLACEWTDLETVKLLVELGADINKTGFCGRNGLLCAAQEGKQDVIKYLHAKNSQFIHSVDGIGDTAFTLACGQADVETIKLLVELGADINLTGKYGRNGLLYAAKGGNQDIIKYLHAKNSEFIPE